MGEKIEKARADFHKFLALLGLMTVINYGRLVLSFSLGAKLSGFAGGRIRTVAYRALTR